MICYSIIIPHYDIPELLVRCLKSIPVREDIQVIVVDDCSPGFETYRERYPELSRPYLELYQTPKGGSAGRARNIGLQHAKGKWILFADADDYYVPDMYEMISSHCADDADAIFFKADSVDTITLQPSDRHVDRNDGVDMYLAGIHNCVEAILHCTVVWATMYAAELIRENNIQFDETLCANDVMFAVKAAYLAKATSFSEEVLYVVTYREGSLHSDKTKKYPNYIAKMTTDARLVRYCRKNQINYKPVPPCVLKDIQGTFRLFGLKAASLHFIVALKDGIMFVGLKEYIKRKVRRQKI